MSLTAPNAASSLPSVETLRWASLAAFSCRAYNYYYPDLGTPTTCMGSLPGQAAKDNNGDVGGYNYEDNLSAGFSHSTTDTFDTLNRLTGAVATAPHGRMAFCANQSRSAVPFMRPHYATLYRHAGVVCRIGIGVGQREPFTKGRHRGSGSHVGKSVYDGSDSECSCGAGDSFSRSLPDDKDGSVCGQGWIGVALVAIEDREHVAKSVESNRREMEFMTQELSLMGVRFTPPWPISSLFTQREIARMISSGCLTGESLFVP
ncbi:MAG: hypothetical protein ACRD2O_05845 [Terriglobia bacterium]